MKDNFKKRLATLFLASTIMLSGCAKSNSEENEPISKNQDEYKTYVLFVLDKAYIFNGKAGLWSDNYWRYDDIGLDSIGVPVLIFEDYQNAIDLATLTVGEGNLIYLEYNETQNLDYSLILK